MKFNFKKIASVLTSTVMLSSTIAFAAAANFPEPFVKDGSGNYAIVVGAGANTAAGDQTAALNIQAYLADMVTDTDDTPITVEGDSFLLEKSNNKINLGDGLDDTHSSLDDDELSTILAEGVYENEAGDEFDYTQKITLGTTGIDLEHFADSDVNENEEPVIGFDIASGVTLVTYDLDFTDSPVVGTDDDMETTDLTFLGKTYYVSTVDNSSELEMTLLDSANSATVFSDEPITVTVGGETYDVEIVSVSESDTPTNSKATLKVNGEQIASTNQGSSRKIGDDIYLSILEVNEASRESDRHYVEFSIGNGQIVLADGQEVEINDETVDGLTVDFTVSGTGANAELDKMTLTWETDEQTFLVPGEELVLPGFESVKLIMGDFVASEKETVKVKYSSDDYIYVEAPVKGGDVKIPLLNFGGDTDIDNLGSDTDEVLVTSASTGSTSTAIQLSLNESENTMFVATSIDGDEAESYVFQLTGISKLDSGVKNVTTLKNLATGVSTDITVSDGSGQDKDFGEINLLVFDVNDATGTAKVNITGTGTVYADRVATEEGLTFRLPVDSVAATGSTNLINLTDSPTSWIFNFTEEDYDNGDLQGGASFTANISANSDGPEVSSVSVNTIAVNEDSDDEEGYVVSEMATKVLYRAGDDQRTLDVVYNGEEAYAKVYVAEGAATSSSGGNSGSMIVTDDEVASVSSKNLIVVGGTCVNKVAAKVLGVDAQYPVCGDAWESLTTVGAGEFLIQTVTSPYSSGKVAMLVAGYNQADTANAASALETETIDTAETRPYVQSAGSTLSLV